MTIGERIKQYRKQNKMSMAKISAATGIPADRLYKWEKGTRPSLAEDLKVIEDFLSGNLESIPQPMFPKGPSEDKYIQTLEALNKEYLERITELKQRFVNLERLMVSLEHLTQNQAVIEARVELAVELLAEVHPILAKKKTPLEAAHALDKRLGPKIEKALKRGIPAGKDIASSKS